MLSSIAKSIRTMRMTFTREWKLPHPLPAFLIALLFDEHVAAILLLATTCKHYHSLQNDITFVTWHASKTLAALCINRDFIPSTLCDAVQTYDMQHRLCRTGRRVLTPSGYICEWVPHKATVIDIAFNLVHVRRETELQHHNKLVSFSILLDEIRFSFKSNVYIRSLKIQLKDSVVVRTEFYETMDVLRKFCYHCPRAGDISTVYCKNLQLPICMRETDLWRHHVPQYDGTEGDFFSGLTGLKDLYLSTTRESFESDMRQYSQLIYSCPSVVHLHLKVVGQPFRHMGYNLDCLMRLELESAVNFDESTPINPTFGETFRMMFGGHSDLTKKRAARIAATTITVLQ
jgi:hypothetical protein